MRQLLSPRGPFPTQFRPNPSNQADRRAPERRSAWKAGKRDIVYAVRSLASAKKFSAIVILTLALGLGANTAVFGVLHAVVLRPLPYDDPDRLVRVYHVAGKDDNYMPQPAFRAFRDNSTTLDLAPVYTYNAEGADLTDRAQPGASECCQSDPSTSACSACGCWPGNRSSETPSAPMPAWSSSGSGSGASISAPVPTRPDSRCRSTASVSRSSPSCPMRSRTRSCQASRSGRRSTSRVRTGRSGTTTT